MKRQARKLWQRKMITRTVPMILFPMILLVAGLLACSDKQVHRQMQGLLAETVRYDSCHQWFTSDSIPLSLVDYFSIYGTPSERTQSYYLLGRAYDAMGEVSMALLCYREALSTADTANLRMMSRLYAYIGKQYIQFHDDSLQVVKIGIKELRLAERYANRCADTLLRNNSRLLIQIATKRLHHEDSVRDFTWMRKQADTLVLVNPSTGITVIRALARPGITDPDFLGGSRVKVFSPDVITNFFRHRQDERQKLEQMVCQQLYIAVIGIVLLIGAFMLYGYYRRRMRRQLMEINTRYALDIARFNELCAERDRLSHQVEEKAKIEQQLADVKLRLAELIGDTSWDLDSSQLSLAVVSDLHKCASLGRQATDADMQRLMLLGESRLPKFIEALRQYDGAIASQNLIFCLLVKLHFLSSELSVLLGKSPQAVTNQKRRLLRKLFKEEGGAHDFEDKIRQLGIEV